MLSLVWFSLLNVFSNTRSFNSFLQIINLHFHWTQTRVQQSISNLSSKTETRQWNWKWQQRNEKCRKVEKRQCPELDSGEAMKMKKRRFVSSVEVENDRQTEDHIFLSFVWSQLHQSKEFSIHFLFLNNDLFTSAYSFPIKITSHSKWQNLLSTLILINWKENCRLSSPLWPLSLSNFRCFSQFLSWKSRELFIEFNIKSSDIVKRTTLVKRLPSLIRSFANYLRLTIRRSLTSTHRSSTVDDRTQCRTMNNHHSVKGEVFSSLDDFVQLHRYLNKVQCLWMERRDDQLLHQNNFHLIFSGSFLENRHTFFTQFSSFVVPLTRIFAKNVSNLLQLREDRFIFSFKENNDSRNTSISRLNDLGKVSFRELRKAKMTLSQRMSL